MDIPVQISRDIEREITSVQSTLKVLADLALPAHPRQTTEIDRDALAWLLGDLSDRLSLSAKSTQEVSP